MFRPRHTFLSRADIYTRTFPSFFAYAPSASVCQKSESHAALFLSVRLSSVPSFVAFDRSVGIVLARHQACLSVGIPSLSFFSSVNVF